jgi:hypothetical protein
MHTRTHTLTHTHTHTYTCTHKLTHLHIHTQIHNTHVHFCNARGHCHTSVTGAATLPLRVLPHFRYGCCHTCPFKRATPPLTDKALSGRPDLVVLHYVCFCFFSGAASRTSFKGAVQPIALGYKHPRTKCAGLLEGDDARCELQVS